LKCISHIVHAWCQYVGVIYSRLEFTLSVLSQSLIRKPNLITRAGETSNTLQKSVYSLGPILQVRKLQHREVKWLVQWLLRRAAPRVNFSSSNPPQGRFEEKQEDFPYNEMQLPMGWGPRVLCNQYIHITNICPLNSEPFPVRLT